VPTTQDLAPAVPVPAYPHPITLPVAPRGNPMAARLLAAAYRGLADDLDVIQRRVDAIVLDLSTHWTGQGSRALVLPRTTIEDNARTLAAAARSAAEHLDDYANALEKAQHHHGWSLGRMIAIGAVVAVTAAVVIVTVGAAAPVGTVAAIEVGEAIAGAEAAAGAATAAEASATAGLSLAGQSMTGMRALVGVVLPHLTQGAVSTGVDVGLHLATGRPVSSRDLEVSFLAGVVGSASTSATRAALHSTETFQGVNRLGQAALDTTALTATLASDDALGQYATTGHVDPGRLTRDALLTALTGGLATLRNPMSGTGYAVNPGRQGTGQTLADLDRNGVDLAQHEGRWPFGHTLAKHVGRTEVQLTDRLAVELELKAVSSFTDVATAERAILDTIRRNPEDLAKLLTGSKTAINVSARLPYMCGLVVSRNGHSRAGKDVLVKLVLVQGRVVVRTAFVE
jgi:Bacterial CdiA-CT RNAse A domain